MSPVFIGMEEQTGFEGKTMKAVITAWLYCQDEEVITGAAKEMRKRFSRAFPRPPWILETTDGANHTKLNP